MDLQKITIDIINIKFDSDQDIEINYSVIYDKKIVLYKSYVYVEKKVFFSREVEGSTLLEGYTINRGKK